MRETWVPLKMSQCQHITLKGVRCSRPTDDNGEFCRQHRQYLTYQPEEIIGHISSTLDPRSLSKLSGVSRRLHTIVQPIITKELKEKITTFLKEEDIPAFYVVGPECEYEDENGEGMSWTFENLGGTETNPRKNSVYLWIGDEPIYVDLPETYQTITFNGLTTVQQFVDAILEGYHDAGIIDIMEVLGDHHFYEGLHKVEPGYYEMRLGS